MEEIKKLLRENILEYNPRSDYTIFYLEIDKERRNVSIKAFKGTDRFWDWETFNKKSFKKLIELLEERKELFIKSFRSEWDWNLEKYIPGSSVYIAIDAIKDKKVNLQLQQGNDCYYISYKGESCPVSRNSLPEVFKVVKDVKIATSIMNSDKAIETKIATRERQIKKAKAEIEELKQQQESINTAKELLKQKLGEDEYNRQLLLHEIKKF